MPKAAALHWSFRRDRVRIAAFAPSRIAPTSRFLHASPPAMTEPANRLLPNLYRWSDAISPLVLARCVQPAFSLTILLLACAAYWATWLAHREIDRRLPDSPPPSGAWVLDLDGADQGRSVFDAAARYSLSPAVVPSLAIDNSGMWKRLFKQLVMYLIWLFPLGVLLRASITHCAERRTSGLGSSVRLVRSRALAMVSAVLIPLLAVLIVSVIFWLTGVLARLWPLAGDLLMLCCVPLLIAAGVLAIGSVFAVPLAWASLLTEDDCDTFDALSRGYEYTVRRILHLAVYLLVAWGIHWVAYQLVRAVCEGGWTVAARLYSSGALQREMPEITRTFMLHLPQVFAIVMLWSLVGGIYLLLRRDANSQEIEDIKEDLLPPFSAARPPLADDSISNPAQRSRPPR